METESFREQNRRRREKAAFRNLYEYARNTSIADPKKSAERAARELHAPATDGAAGRVAKLRRAAVKKGKSGRSADSQKVPRNLEARTKEQLYTRAQELEIEGRSQMSKDELVAAIRASQ
jgi:hypothetical protein